MSSFQFLTLDDDWLITGKWAFNDTVLAPATYEAQVEFRRHRDGALEYLQSDEESWGVTRVLHDITYDAATGRWDASRTDLAPFTGQLTDYVLSINHDSAPEFSGTAYVHTVDLDDLAGASFDTATDSLEAIRDALETLLTNPAVTKPRTSARHGPGPG